MDKDYAQSQIDWSDDDQDYGRDMHDAYRGCTKAAAGVKILGDVPWHCKYFLRDSNVMNLGAAKMSIRIISCTSLHR